MRRMTIQKRFILSVVAALLLAIAVPSTSFAQGRGNGRGHNKDVDWSSRIDRNRSNSVWRNRNNNDNWRHRSSTWRNNKKCGKFVNCHDARAGRVDGRGPRGTRVGNLVWRNRWRNRNTDTTTVWRNRNRRTVRRVYENR
jgi:hypothetical protein